MEQTGDLWKLAALAFFDSPAAQLGQGFHTHRGTYGLVNSPLQHAVAVMNEFGAPWGIAGGWAIDLFLGFPTRPHADVDIAILRRDQHRLRARLEGAHASKVVAHQLSPWRSDEVLASPVHEVHARWTDGTHLEFLLNDDDPATAEWVYRRDSRIRRSLHATFRHNGEIPYLAPELVLLYKSKAPSPKDEADFNSVRPRLTSEQRAWLRRAIAFTAPAHPWAEILVQEP